MTLPGKPSGIPEDIEEHIKLMYDLLALAWQTGDHAHRAPSMLGQGIEQCRVSEERHPGLVPHSFASLEQREQQGAVRGAEPLSRGAVCVLPRQALEDRRTARARCWITRSCCTGAG